jgi:hypothetical protein
MTMMTMMQVTKEEIRSWRRSISWRTAIETLDVGSTFSSWLLVKRMAVMVTVLG